MLRQMEQALAVARQESAAVSGRVTIGLAPTTVCRLGLPLLLHLREKYPRVTLNIVEGLSGNLEHMTRLGQFDLAVLFSQSAASDLRVEPLLEEELFVILPASSKLVPRERDSLTLLEISKLPLILPSPNHGLRRRIALEFERTNTTLEAVAEIDSLPLLMSCVARGMGATIKPQVAVQALGDAPLRWRCLRISDAHMTRTSYLYSLPTEQLSSCAAVVHAELRHLVRDLVEAGEWTGVTLPPCGPEDLNLDSEVNLAALAS
jgi:LysR family tcuABC transcriptional regulator